MTPRDPFDLPVTPELLGQIIDRHTAALELFARQWTAAADDCVQEALIELAGQTPVPDDPVAWLYRVVRNRALNRVRSESRRRHREEEHAKRGANWFSEDLDAELDGRQITAALQGLPDRPRQLIIARLWGDLTFQQIAELIGASTSSAHREYQAALTALRERLDESCEMKNESRTN